MQFGATSLWPVPRTLSGDRNRIEVPNVFGVFQNGAVAGKFPDPRGVEDRHFAPAGFVLERGGDFFLGVAIGFEVG